MRLLVGFLVVLVGFTSPAMAHKLKVFAAAIGTAIEGRVYFVGGGAAQDVPVTLQNGAGELVAATRTSVPGGTFSFTVGVRDTYRVTADAQDGHRAEFMIASDRFADELPAVAAAGDGDAASAGGSPSPVAIAGSRAATPSADGAAMEAALARQLAPLLDEIGTLRDTLAFRDILGTTGIIFGAFGAWALFAARRKQR